MRVARSCGAALAKPGTAISSGAVPALSAVGDLARPLGVSLVTTTSLIIAAGAWSHMPMQGVYSSEKAPSAEVSPTCDAEHLLEFPATASSPAIAVDDVVAQADRHPALRRQREEGVEARHALDLDPRQAGRLGDRLHGFRRDPAIAILNRMQNVHHPVRVIAEAGAYFDEPPV